jgi:hypothetical protein
MPGGGRKWRHTTKDSMLLLREERGWPHAPEEGQHSSQVEHNSELNCVTLSEIAAGYCEGTCTSPC